MNYQELIFEIESRTGKAKYYGSERIHSILRILGNPHRGMKYFHIAGTNGKGSVSNYLREVLMQRYSVGFFTSPHLISYCDRIRIGAQEISEEDFLRLGKLVLAAEEEIIDEFDRLSLFECITVIGLLYFREKNCDYVVLEVGMGGRYDSTNVIEPQDKLVSILTSISLDHMSFLGDSVEEIAWQKAGIIGEQGLCVTSNTKESVLSVIEEECKEKGARLVKTGEIFVSHVQSTWEGTTFDFSYQGQRHLHLTQIGAYQVENALLAYVALKKLVQSGKLELTEAEIQQGFYHAQWPGRMELVSHHPKILLDGAHNLAGIEKLVESLRRFSFARLYVVVSILSDKEHAKMLSDMAQIATKVFIAPIAYKRGTDTGQLLEEAKAAGLDAEVMGLDEALKQAKTLADKEDLILVTGSLYFVSEARAKILTMEKEID